MYLLNFGKPKYFSLQVYLLLIQAFKKCILQGLKYKASSIIYFLNMYKLPVNLQLRAINIWKNIPISKQRQTLLACTTEYTHK